MYKDRIELYQKLEKEFDSKLIVYVTSDRANMSAQIAPDVIDFFVDQLDTIGSCKKISLYLYTRGGDMAAAWNIVNLLRMYCEQLQVIVPHKAHSAGTIISLGANEIIMTKQATLGPIDPSLSSPLNPSVQNGKNQQRQIVPVSVEAVKGYLEFAKNEANINDESAMTSVLLKLSESVHPLVLGQVYRSRAQIQMLAEKLLSNQFVDSEEKIKKVVSFLCSDSGSHDYTINRREAKNDLGLNVVKPTEEQYQIIKAIYDNIKNELKFNSPFNPSNINGEYASRRSLLESICGGSDYFVTEGEIVHLSFSDGKSGISNVESFSGWRHEPAETSDPEVYTDNAGIEGLKYEKSDDFKM